VIAGSVVELTAPEIRDLDTYTDEGAHAAGVPEGTQKEDHSWKYRATCSAGEIKEPEGWTGESPTCTLGRDFVWAAPTTEQDVTFTFIGRDYRTGPGEKYDVDYAGSSEAMEGTEYTYLTTGVIHVHALEIGVLYGGRDMYEALYHPKTDWHAYWDCEGWDNDASTRVSTYKWVDGETAPVLFEGQHVAEVVLYLRAADHVEVDVPPQTIRVHAPWPAEGPSLELSGTATVDHLPFAYVCCDSSDPIDNRITWDAALTWNWVYDIPVGSQYETPDVDIVNDPTLHDVATSYDAIVAPAVEVTPKRVQEVYTNLAVGELEDSEPVGIAENAALWVGGPEGNGVGGVTMFSGAAGWYYSESATGHEDEDVQDDAHLWDLWCGSFCGGYADCLGMATLAALACKLVGVDANADAAYARELWADDWRFSDLCFSGVSGHGNRMLRYWNGEGQRFEGHFWVNDLSSVRHYRTVNPPSWWTSLALMVTTLAHPERGGYCCREANNLNDPDIRHDPGTHPILEPVQ